MRKKIGKRIGPVPITLAVFALAAFLSAGLLLALNGAPTAEAQSADCTVGVDKDGKVTLPKVDSVDGCEVQGDAVTVVFEGATDIDGDVMVSLLIKDTAGPITAYPNGTTWKSEEPGFQLDNKAVTAMRYSYRLVTVSEAEINPTTGIREGQKVSVVVKGDVYVWNQAVEGGAADVTIEIDDIPPGNAASGARQIASGSKLFTITLLGNPAIGKDGADRNKIVDDYIECTLGANEADPLTVDPDGEMADCDPKPGSKDAKGTEADDPDESRSKLELDKGASFIAAEDGSSVLDGTEATVILEGEEETAVTIRATIKDANGKELEDVEVTFAATSVPASIGSSTRDIDSDANGVAHRVISGLPRDEPYQVTVVVTAGEDNLEVGTIVIARAGDLDTVTATACAEVTGDDDKMDGCMAGYNPKMIYGQGDEFSIYAKATDSQGIEIEVDEDSFKVKPVTMDDYGDATKAFNITAAGTPVSTDDGTVELTVKDNAPGAKYLLDVVATTGTGDDMITRNQQVEIIVSGDLAEYTVEGPAYIALDGNAMYTVTAMDENGNPPVFDGDENKVRVLVQPNTVLVTNVTNDDLMLNKTTGMGTFTVYAPLSAANGDLGRIIIGTGAMQVVENITFGMPNQAPMAGAAIADQMVTAGETAMVRSTITDPDLGDTLTWTVMSDMPMYATATVDSIGMVTITGVAAGMATITVTANDGDGETATQTIMVTVLMMPPMELGAPSITNVMSEAEGMATVMLTPGDNATKHWAWAAPTDGSAGMWHGDSALAGDATMVTFSGLTSGMNYWFIAIAGRGTGADLEWSAWSGWTAETPIQ